jgi:hypothetical protein
MVIFTSSMMMISSFGRFLTENKLQVPNYTIYAESHQLTHVHAFMGETNVSMNMIFNDTFTVVV